MPVPPEAVESKMVIEILLGITGFLLVTIIGILISDRRSFKRSVKELGDQLNRRIDKVDKDVKTISDQQIVNMKNTDYFRRDYMKDIRINRGRIEQLETHTDNIIAYINRRDGNGEGFKDDFTK